MTKVEFLNQSKELVSVIFINKEEDVVTIETGTKTFQGDISITHRLVLTTAHAERFHTLLGKALGLKALRRPLKDREEWKL